MAWHLLDKASKRVSSVWTPWMVAAIGPSAMVATALVAGRLRRRPSFVNQNKMHNEAYRAAYAQCMASRGYGS